MLTFLIVFGVISVVVSASIVLAACAASARQTERENWAEQPLVMREVGQPAGQPKRVTF